MNIIAFLLVGLIAGYLAGKIVEGHGFGTLGDIVVGIVGAFIGGFIAPHVIGDGAGFWSEVVIATVGSIVLLLITGLFTSGKKTSQI